jgi:predicted DNA-binding transcriptional regulator YafY
VDGTKRFYEIEMRIRARRCASCDELLAEVEVSRATLKRDLQYLRRRMNAPIVYDRFDNEYKLHADPRDKRQASRQLPGVCFSEREIHALLTMYQLIEGLDDGGLLARHLHPILEKLHGMLGAGESDAKEMVKRVKIVGAGRRAVSSKWFEIVGDALLKRRRLHMRYRTRGRGESNERDVSPQRLVHHRHTWSLDAWCHEAGGRRRFALDAIEDVAVLATKTKDVALKTVEDELDGGYGAYVGNKAQWSTLVFTPEAAQWVSQDWHPQQEIKWLADSSFELRVPYADPMEFAMDVLRHGEQVVVDNLPNFVML